MNNSKVVMIKGVFVDDSGYQQDLMPRRASVRVYPDGKAVTHDPMFPALDGMPITSEVWTDGGLMKGLSGGDFQPYAGEFTRCGIRATARGRATADDVARS